MFSSKIFRFRKTKTHIDKMPFLDPANFGKLFSSRPKEVKPPPPKKDTSVFGGKSYAKPRDVLGYGIKNADEIYRLTQGRVRRQEVSKYLEDMTKKSYVYKDKYGSGVVNPEKIRKELRDKLSNAKTPQERANIQRDMRVAEKMLGLEKK